MTKITDEMVEIAYGWSPKGCGIQRWQIRDMLIMALNAPAALSPKPEPEIEVTENMEEAGVTAAMNYEQRHPQPPFRVWPYALVASIYRAMRALEPKAQEGAAYAAKSAPQGVNAAAPVKETGGGVGMVLIKDRRTSSRERRAPQDIADLIWRRVNRLPDRRSSNSNDRRRYRTN